MNYGYCRCSTLKQDLDNQKYEILKFADAKKIRIDQWETEVVTSRKDYKERKLGGLIVDRLKKGDTLVVSEISRLGRSLTEVMSILHTLIENGINVYTCKEKFQLDNSINSKVLAFAFSLAGEIERQMISLRTKESLARLKSEGRTLGRPVGSLSENTKLSGKDAQIQELLNKGVSKSSIAKICDVSRGTLLNHMKTRMAS